MADTGVTEALQGESTTPSLTLNPFGTAEAPKPEEIQLTTGKQEVADAKEVMEQQLTPEEMKMVDDFAAQIDITDSGTIMTYGAATQQKMADFSNRALDNVRTLSLIHI